MYFSPTSYSFDFGFKNIFVKDLINNKKLNCCDLITTKAGSSNVVNSTTVMDVLDIGPWLHEGDALIISRFITTCFTFEFIDMLISKKISCIITQIKFRNYITIEKENYLKQNDLPIIFVEDNTSWSEVIVTIQNLIINLQTEYVLENQKLQTSIVEYLSSEYSLDSLCEIVYNLTGISVAIADYYLHILDKTTNNDWIEDLFNLKKSDLSKYVTIGENFDGSIVRGYVYTSLANKNNKYFIIPSSLPKLTIKFYIIVKSSFKTMQLPPQIICRIKTIESIYSLKLSILTDFKKSNYYFKSIIFQKLLEMNCEDNFQKQQISLSLNSNLKDKYNLIIVKNSKQNNICKNVDYLTNFIDYIKHAEFFNEDILIFLYKEKWVFLIDSVINSIKNFSDKLYTSLSTYFATQQFKLGVSNNHNYWNLKQAYREADFSLNYLKNTNNKSISIYNELGIIKLFSNNTGNINEVYIQELFENYVKPIMIYDNKHSTELLTTLTSLFTNEMSYKTTSKNLFIHVNTLRARINKIEEILNINLKNLDTIMTLRICTLLYQFDYFESLLITNYN